MAYGTLTTYDLLATTQQSVVEFGEDRVWEAIRTSLDAHNQQYREAVEEIAEVSTDRRRRYGGPDSMTMQEADEFSTPDAQKVTSGAVVEFPLRKYEIGNQWTRDYLLNATPAEVATQVTAMMDADIKNLHLQLKKALFVPTNYTYEDRFDDHVELAVKRLVNADGAIIPVAPSGATFDGSSHSHYIGTSNFVNTNLTTGVSTVNEHFLNGEVQIYIHQNQESTVNGFTGFTKYLPNTLIAPNNALAARESLDVQNTSNRAIGDFNGVQVWVKPWIPSGYVLFIQKRATQKALVMRTPRKGTGDFRNVFEYDNFPLHNKGFERKVGFGVYNRVAAAVLDTANSSYTAPSL